jgi:hypothetical protein
MDGEEISGDTKCRFIPEIDVTISCSFTSV